MSKDLNQILNSKGISEPYKGWTILAVDKIVENYGGNRKEELRDLLVEKIDDIVESVTPKSNMKITNGAVGQGRASIIEVGTAPNDISPHYPKDISPEKMREIQQAIPQITYTHELCHLLLKGKNGFGAMEGLIQALAVEITGMDEIFPRSVGDFAESFGADAFRDQIQEYTPYNAYRENAPMATMLRVAVGSKEDFMIGALTNPTQVRADFDRRNNDLVTNWKDGAISSIITLIEDFDTHLGMMVAEPLGTQMKHRKIINKFLSYALENRANEFLSTPKSEKELLEFKQDIEIFKKNMMSNPYESLRAEMPHVAKVAFVEARIDIALSKVREVMQESLSSHNAESNQIANEIAEKHAEIDFVEHSESFYQYRVIQAVKTQKFRFNDLPSSSYELQQELAAYLKVAKSLESQGLEGHYQKFIDVPDVSAMLKERFPQMAYSQIAKQESFQTNQAFTDISVSATSQMRNKIGVAAHQLTGPQRQVGLT